MVSLEFLRLFLGFGINKKRLWFLKIMIDFNNLAGLKKPPSSLSSPEEDERGAFWPAESQKGFADYITTFGRRFP
jgi:hypothetical protein